MRTLEWHAEAFDDLVDHDAWRVSHGWSPIAPEIMDSVSEAFHKGDIFPKSRCQIFGEIVPVYRTWVEVRSKRFFVYFLETPTCWVIRRVLHPRPYFIAATISSAVATQAPNIVSMTARTVS